MPGNLPDFCLFDAFNFFLSQSPSEPNTTEQILKNGKTDNDKKANTKKDKSWYHCNKDNFVSRLTKQKRAMGDRGDGG